MSTRKFVNPWDDTLTVTGNVYVQPVYSSGVESGTAMRTAPATLHFTAGVGAPARHMNYALFQLGDNSVKTSQHRGMRFVSSAVGDWTTGTGSTLQPAIARGWRGFIVGNGTSVSLIRDPENGKRLDILGAAGNPPLVAIDDTINIWTFHQNVGVVKQIQAATATQQTISNFAPLAGRCIGGTGPVSMIIGTTSTGSALNIQTLSGTAFTSVSSSAGPYATATSSLWASSQVFLGAQTATGNVLFYAKGPSSNKAILFTGSATATPTDVTLPAGADRLIDIAYDDVQGQFIAAMHSSTGSNIAFYTTVNNGSTWTSSSTAGGPLSLLATGTASAGQYAFSVCCGVWLLASTTAVPSGVVYGGSGGSGTRVFAWYSLDYGVTWYPCVISLGCSAASSLRITCGVNSFLISTDSGFAVSEPMGYPEPL